MKKYFFVFLAVMVLAGVIPAKAQTITSSPATVTVKTGEAFSVAFDIGTVSDLFGAAFDLDYNPSLLDFNSATEGNLLSSGCSTSFMTAENTPGKIISGLTRLGTDCGGVAGPGRIAAFNFTAGNTAGSANLSFSNTNLCILSDGLCNYNTGTWNGANITIENSTVSVCSDGTAYGSCSAGAPWYCNDSGSLVENCTVCGCSNGWVCSGSGTACEEPAPASFCGDGSCNGGETCSTCPGDCGACSSSGGGGGSASSNTGSGSNSSDTSSANGSLPENVENISTERDDSSITINWQKGAGYNGENIIVIRSTESIASTFSFAAANDIGDIVYEGTGDGFVDQGAAPDKIYYYAIYTKDNNDNYSIGYVIKKLPLSVSAEAAGNTDTSHKINYAGDWYGYSDYIELKQIKTLGGLDGDSVNFISREEATDIFSNNGKVPLSDVTKELYDRIIGAWPYDLGAEDKYSIAWFIHFGTYSTLYLGAGERAGALNSYIAAFGKFPRSEAEWQDVVKISGGRWPQEKSVATEQKAQSEYFVKIYKRQPDMADPHDNAAVTVISYGLRPANRNVDSEKAGIKIFEAIYGHSPASATDWDIVRAIAYSGAVR